MRSIRGLEATLLGTLVLLLACDAGRPQGEELATEVLRARTQGLAYLQEDRLEEARAEFLRLAELAPEEPAGPANLALVALRGGEFEEAERLARGALSRRPEDPAVRLILAKTLEAQGRAEEARSERERVVEIDPGNLRALWALSGGSSEVEGFEDAPDRLIRLALVSEGAPTSLPPRFELVDGHLARGEADLAAAQLEEIRALVPEFPPGGIEAFDLALGAARALDAEGAREPARRLHDLIRTTPVYQGGLESLRGPLGAATGFPVLAFSHELMLEVPDEAAVLAALQFRDATEFSGLGALGEGDRGPDGPEPVVAVGDFDGDGDQDLYVWMPSSRGGGGYLLRNDLGRFVDVTPEVVGNVQGVRDASFSDYDADGLSDLYLVRDGPNRLFRNRGDGQLLDVSEEAGAADAGDGLAGIFADVDHDGDLDLLVANREDSRLYRNDGAGRFMTVPGAMGLFDGAAIVDVAFGDLDDDGDLDLVMARGAGGVQVMANQRQGVFRAVAGVVQGATGRADAVAIGDYDNDGFPDLVVVGEGTVPALFRGQGDGRFVSDARSSAALPDGSSGGVDFLDFDNDGFLDLVVSASEGLALLHNDGRGVFEDFTRILPTGSTEVAPLAVLDYNEDGDLDVLAGSPTGLRLLRNDGGNLNHHMSLSLVARGPGSGKVNRFAVGSTVEIRAGDLYQSRTVRGPVTHFGLGSRLKADVIRIVWTNGVPQYLYFPGTDQDLLETQKLKGSCAFIYAWDGENYEFVTDAMWGSALGMPIGIMGGGVTSSWRVYAPAASAHEYIRIPGERLRAQEGKYRLQITEELWELAYVDEVKLLAIDHPSSVELFVDEKFVPPAPPHLGLYLVGERLLPTSALDGAGNDILATLAAKDARYVSNLRARRYQGIVAPHEIVLELPDAAADADGPFLFLQGWIFPSDASINVAVSQSDHESVMSPRLEVPDGRGGWRTVIADIGFPAGKDKTVVVDLGGLIRREDPRIRIRTTAQVYWDHAFFAVGDVAGPAVAADAENAFLRLGGPGQSTDHDDLRVQLLIPTAADLHYRGFSREYRKGGRHGPHWFEYNDVSAESPWLPIRGRYTRYGDVLPLLGASDDMYSVMAPGDEMTVEFDAGIEPLPDGWTRTFLLYTDAWLKDSDLNTATGNTVAPLPFHGQSQYPYGPSEAYPSDAEHRAYLERYQTRDVTGSMLGLAPGTLR